MCNLKPHMSHFIQYPVINSNIIYVAGLNDSDSYGHLYKSINSGLNWSNLTLITNMYILDMQFLNFDSGCGMWFSAGPHVRTTTDGGITWTVRINGINNETQNIFFLNYNTGWCGDNIGGLYKTTNAGLNWNSIGSFPQTIQSIFFLTENIGWVGFQNY